jgi:hypothetical protein
MRWAVGLLLLASCRAVFGLDSPELIDAPAGISEHLASSGVYTFSPFKSGFDWSSAVFYGPPGLLESTHRDRLYYLAINSTAPNTFAVTYAASAEITIAAGQATQVSLQAAPLAQSECAHLNAALGTRPWRTAIHSIGIATRRCMQACSA